MGKAKLFFRVNIKLIKKFPNNRERETVVWVSPEVTGEMIKAFIDLYTPQEE